MANWITKRLKNVAILYAGGTPDTSNEAYWNGNIRWMSSGEVNLKRVYEVKGRITELGYKSSSTKIVPPNSILVALAGQGKTRGTVAINKVELTTNQSLAAIVLKDKDIDYEFLYYSLDYRYDELRQLSVGSGRAGLNLEILNNLKISYPQLAKQKKIAEILSTWDKAIETTENLITAKQTRKRALMQRLLTGKQRFPRFIKNNEKFKTKFGEFPSDWDYLHIGDIARESSTKNQNGRSLTVLSCTKYKGLVDSLSYFGKRIFSEDTSTYKIVKRGQFAYATNHIEEGSIGYQDLYEEALISPMYTVFETNEQVKDSFFYKLLKTELYRHIFEINTSGSIDRRGALRWGDFARIKVALPSLEEQQCVAEVLNVCDKEIELLEKQRDVLKEQKRGLMQQLLTGNVPVKIDEEAESGAATI